MILLSFSEKITISLVATCISCMCAALAILLRDKGLSESMQFITKLFILLGAAFALGMYFVVVMTFDNY
jgi:CHASE3 domain sensor protein